MVHDNGLVNTEHPVTLKVTPRYDFCNREKRKEWFDIVIALFQYLQSGDSRVGFLNNNAPKNMLHKDVEDEMVRSGKVPREPMDEMKDETEDETRDEINDNTEGAMKDEIEGEVDEILQEGTRTGTSVPQTIITVSARKSTHKHKLSLENELDSVGKVRRR